MERIPPTPNRRGRKLRVALVSYDFGEYCIRIANELARLSDLLLLLPEREAKPYRRLMGRHVRLRAFHKPRLRQPIRQIRTLAGLWSAIRGFRPEVIHLQAGHLWFNAGLLPWLGRYPLVLTVHDPVRHLGDRGAHKTPQWLLDFGARRASQLIVHAPQLKQQVMESLGLPGEKIHVIPHVLCGNEENGGVFGGPEQDPCVLFFGRIWEYKGLDYLIRAEPLIAAQVPDVKFIIAGTGEDFARYRRLMEHPERFVVHNEYVSDEMRARLFRQASLVALPYVEASQSGVIPVAYSFGKPVVATSVGGLPALVDDGRTGFLIPPRDEQALATAIVRLLQDKDLRLRMGACAKQKLHAECAPARVAAQTFAVYRRAVDLDTPERGA